MKSLQNTKTPIIYQIFISGCSWSKSEKLETSEIRKNILDVKKYAQNLAKEFGSGEEELKMKDHIDDISKFALKISSDESKVAEVKKP